MNQTSRLFITTLRIITFLTAIGSYNISVAQMQANRIKNFDHFTNYSVSKDEEVLQVNKDFASDAELGMTFAETPCKDCYEIIAKRTENTKTYAKKGSYGNHIWVQSSTQPMHYKNATGNWETIQTKLHKEKQGVYVTIASKTPITINTREGFVSMVAEGKRFDFSSHLELVFVRADGTEQSLGTANWSNHTAGDEGVHVKNIWKDIDMDIYVHRGSVKTNFYINKPMPALANGTLLIRDNLKLNNGLKMHYTGSPRWAGETHVNDANGNSVFDISPVIAYEQRDPINTQMLSYRMRGNVLDMEIPGTMLNKSILSYPLVIDPLVSGTNSVNTGGSDYFPACFTPGGCSYTNTVTVPPAITVSGVYFSYSFFASFLTTPAVRKDKGWFDITVGTCKSRPGTTVNVNSVWACAGQANSNLPGECYGENIPILADVKSCIKPPQCASYTLDFILRLGNCHQSHPSCMDYYIFGYDPFEIVVEGRTVEWDTLKSIATIGTICEQDSARLYCEGKFGVPPYTYLWNPGGYTTKSVMVKPNVTTVYNAIITDQCGNTAPGTAQVNVIPVDSADWYVTPAEICQGGEVTVVALGDSAATHFNWRAPKSNKATVTASKNWKTTYDTAGRQIITLAYKSGNCIFYFDTPVIVHPTTYVTNNVAICNGETYTVGTHMYATTGTYVDQFVAAGGCDSIITTNLTVNPIPPAPIVKHYIHACAGDSLIMTASDIPDATYKWTGANGYSDTMQNSTLRNAAVNMSGNYSVTATVKNCTSPPSISRIHITDKPVADIRSDKMEMCAEEVAQLQTPSDPIYTSYRWSPDKYFTIQDGIANTGAVVGAKIGYPSSPVYVAVVDSFGCSSNDTILIKTNSCCEVYLPDAFTPNADGKNDVFRMISKGGYHGIDKFIIVNRAGQVMYEGFEEKQGWDGTKDGEPMNMGVYFYYLKYRCVDNRVFEMKGDVTLIR